MKTVSFIAATSNSGKTTIIEKVVRILKERGMRVAVIKHASKGFELDRPGKDSWRFREAGADTVVLVGPEQLAVMRAITAVPVMQELETLAGDADIVICEGFKGGEPADCTIEVFRSGVSGARPLFASDRSINALVSDLPFETAIPRFDWNDAENVAEYIVATLAIR